MPSVNPGPASLTTQQTQAVVAPQNTALRPAELGFYARRLLAFGRAVSLAGTGDVAQLAVINASSFVMTDILVGNAVGGSAAAGNITVNAGAAVTGQNFRAAGVLTGVTGVTTMVPQTVLAAALAILVTNQQFFINNTVAVAGVTVDIYIYGYDLSV